MDNNINLKWIPVNGDMPKERDSFFKRWHNTSKWTKGMWLKESDDVLVTVEFNDGTRQTETDRTHDGKWECEKDSRVIERKVVAWMPMPVEYWGDKNE